MEAFFAYLRQDIAQLKKKCEELEKKNEKSRLLIEHLRNENFQKDLLITELEVAHEHQDKLLESKQNNTPVIYRMRKGTTSTQVTTPTRKSSSKVLFAEARTPNNTPRKRSKCKTPVTPTTTPTKSSQAVKRRCDFSQEPDLATNVIDLITNGFNGKVKQPRQPRRYLFGNYEYDMPKSILTFCLTEWPQNTEFRNGNESSDQSKNMAFNAVYFQEAMIEEWDQFDFLRTNEDACLIGIGNELLVTHLDPKRHRNISDFDVFILRPYLDNMVSGPFTISSLLSDAEADEYNEDE